MGIVEADEGGGGVGDRVVNHLPVVQRGGHILEYCGLLNNLFSRIYNVGQFLIILLKYCRIVIVLCKFREDKKGESDTGTWTSF